MIRSSADADGHPFTIEWTYSDGRYLKWRKLNDGSRGEIEANLGKGVERIPTRIKPLEPDHALAEALFF